MNLCASIEPPREVHCPNDESHLVETLVSNSGFKCVLRYSCRKCDYSAVYHLDRPELDPVAQVRGLIGDSNYAG
jgi:hypothetical protein